MSLQDTPIYNFRLTKLQEIVNADKKCIDIHCGEPGAMHDATLFIKSAFYKHLVVDVSLIIPGGVLLGDSAYAESNFLVPPFKDYGNLSAKQLKFNYLHSSTRIVVENAFGLLKVQMSVSSVTALLLHAFYITFVLQKTTLWTLNIYTMKLIIAPLIVAHLLHQMV